MGIYLQFNYCTVYIHGILAKLVVYVNMHMYKKYVDWEEPLEFYEVGIYENKHLFTIGPT